MLRRVMPLAALVGALLLGAVALVVFLDRDERPPSRDDRWLDVAEEVCDAASHAAQGRRADAMTAFADVHPALHEIAAELTSVDRRYAANLLENKAAVEGAPPDITGRELADLLRELAASTSPTRTPGCV